MGKKEKVIKKLNDEFYKEYNYTENDYIKESLKEQEEEHSVIVSEENENKIREDLIDNIKSEMIEYNTHQGLALCEYLDDINLNNYIDYVVKGCPVLQISPKIIVETETSIPISPKSQLQTIDCPEITSLREHIIMDAGEYDIFMNYIDENYNGKLPTDISSEELMNQLRQKLIKIAGEKNYYKTVRKFGLYHYNKAAKTVNKS